MLKAFSCINIFLVSKRSWITIIYFVQDPGSDFKCEEEGFYPHPRDCKKYFWCLEAAGLGIVAHQFTCPSGLHFNKLADSCDYSRNVHCEKEKKEEKLTTSKTTTEEPRTTTRASISTTRINPLYKSPSRTTQKTTTLAYEESVTEASADLDQEDPKVIKELIELIKKAGGIDQLEKQLNLSEDGPSVPSKVGQVSTTPSSVISKSLVEKIKNRGSLFKLRNNFNGASQPDRSSDRSESKEIKESSTTTKQTQSPVAANKKYASVNRFSRPNPQSAGIESLPESEAVLIEKPQYTSIRRKPAVKPAVVAENDYNGDSENSSQEDTKPVEVESSKKYASINRFRRPQPKPTEAEEEDDEDDEDEIPSRFAATSTSQKPTSKYVNLNRRRVSSTEIPEEER